jgi:hypothetical protein
LVRLPLHDLDLPAPHEADYPPRQKDEDQQAKKVHIDVIARGKCARMRSLALPEPGVCAKMLLNPSLSILVPWGDA